MRNPIAQPIPAHLPDAEKLEDIPEKAVGLAERLGKQSDRTWMALLLIAGICFAGLMLYFHREDQKALIGYFTDALKQNTEALIRCSIALERNERNR